MNTVDFPFNIMAFPAGPECNLDCDYCYYLDKRALYPETENFQMTEELLEEYIKQYIAAHPGPLIQFGWQGGEPTLRGLTFFKKAVEIIETYLPDDWQCQHSFQTNGILIDDKWCKFFRENNFLIGLSLDGPADLHDVYRKDKKGQPSHGRVMKALHLLQHYKVEYNILCVVNNVNGQKPEAVYDFFKNEDVQHIQFIPLVEVDEENKVSSRSIKPGDYGQFLTGVFDRWICNGYGKIFIQLFEECVSAWSGYGTNLCVFSETCGLAPVMEYNGDLYSCDHFVYPEYKLGNITETHLCKLLSSSQQQEFGQSKKNLLPVKCRKCRYNFICHGGCIKNRIQTTEGEKQLNYLCRGYQQFFNYINPYMKEINRKIKQRQSPTRIKKHLQNMHDSLWKDTGRNDPCPCGSGLKYKKCCLNRK